LVTSFKAQSIEVATTIEAAIENKAWESGQVTGSKLKSILEDFHRESVEAVNNKMDELRRDLQQMSGMNNVGGMERLGRMGATRATNTYMHGGRFYAVPPTFQFPKVNLRQGTRLWFKGMTTSVDGGDRILPFRKLDLKMLPKELKNGFKLAWLPIFKYLEEFETEIPKHGSEITDKMIEEYYNDCVDYLKERVSYCFEKGDAMNWTLSTWSKKVQRSYIEKHGNQSDKEHLKEATPSNKERGFKRRKRISENRPPSKYPQRQKRRMEKANTRNTTGDTGGGGRRQAGRDARRTNANVERLRAPHVTRQGDQNEQAEQDDSFMTEFGNVEMTDTMRARARVIEAQVTEEMKEDRDEIRDERNRLGDGVGTDGSLLFVKRRREGEVPANMGDNSAVHRSIHVQLLDRVLEDPSRGASRTSHSTTEGPQMGTCGVAGCTFVLQLTGRGSHGCYGLGCVKRVHSLCTGEHNLFDSDDDKRRFCSERCKANSK
jgi:hypothetical protein